MKTLTEFDVAEKLAGLVPGTRLFVSYVAGGKTTDRAIREAREAREDGLSLRHHEGTFESLHVTKRNELVFTMRSECRRDANGAPAYRTFNPNLGQLLSLEIL